MKRILIAIAIILALMLSVAGVYAATPKATGEGCPMMRSSHAGSGCPMMGTAKASTGSCPMSKTQCSSCQKSGSCPMTATAAMTKAKTTVVCPVMRRPIPNVAKAAGKSVYKGKTYYFCCPSCKKQFDKDPAKYVKPAVAPKTISAVCPVMHTKIPDVAKAAGKSVYKGKTYYFCCPSCKPAFDKDPAKYVKS